MFSKIRSFIARHHRKFIVSGVVIGGAFILKKYAEKKIVEWQEKEMNSILERSRKQQHFESTEKTCNLTITSVVPKLQNSISNVVNSNVCFMILFVNITALPF